MTDIVNQHLATATILSHGYRQPVRPMVTKSGLKLSVQPGRTHYCSPRDEQGPWRSVEVGFPAERVEELMPYAEEPNHPTETVYGWVPVTVVLDIIQKHGGLA